MRFNLTRRPKPAPSPAFQTEFALSDLKRTVRREIIADRKRAVTASLQRFVDRGGVCPLRPRDEVVAGALNHQREC